MKNIIYKSLVLSVGFLFLVSPLCVFAVGFLFSPGSGSYETNRTFSVAVFANPQGNNIYTVKVELKYPANLLSVESFNFSDEWLPLRKPGHDLIDNDMGILIKTAGFPGGFSSQTKLGDVVFRTKSSGTANVSIGGDSMTLDANNNNVFDNVLTRANFFVSGPQIIFEAPALEPDNIFEPEPEEGPKTEEAQVLTPEDLPQMNVFLLAAVSLFNLFNEVVFIAVAFLALAIILILPKHYRNKKINFKSIFGKK